MLTRELFCGDAFVLEKAKKAHAFRTPKKRIDYRSQVKSVIFELEYMTRFVI